MRDIRQYWREVRALEAGLPEFVWLTAVKGSSPVQVAAGQAAALLYSKSHRAATEQEVAEFRASERAADQAAARERLRKSGVAQVAVRT